ncbi:hypothetical protein DPMN_059677 [Dreissena polymorpha]|uniref:Uncharacterized protein n=2 Tax=Dreissena polymorpha TaxID=45954 RepID=A0A9D4HGW4_DREPO|nr:hypothetical protein DPMN_059677 [Dreissena polymorpha]
MAGSSGGMPGAFPGGPMNLPGVTGTMAGPAPIDMTSFFNEQGQMGAGGGLAGLANINYVRMQDLDRRGVIDLSDLTPAGLAAANAHFSG